MDESSHANPAQLLLERLPLVTYLLRVDAAAPPIYINSQVETLFGFPPAELLADGDYWMRRVVDGDREMLIDALASVRAGNGPMCVEYCLVRLDDETVWVRDTASIQDGLIHGYIVDITREKRLERELARGPVTIHVVRGVVAEATPGQIWLDASLLDTGRFAWGVVQHEYGHQVDFALLDDSQRARLHSLLGGTSWCSGASHDQLTCERFADLISWACWRSPDNVMTVEGARWRRRRSAHS